MSILYIIPMFVSGGLIPTYLTVKNVGLIDTFWVMVIPFAVSSYNIIVARTFFNNSIPDGMWEADRKSTRLNSSHSDRSRMPSSA